MLMIETWNKEESGIQRSESLMLAACEAGAFGKSFSYTGGSVKQAGFTFLCGEADEGFYVSHPQLFEKAWLVCRSRSWEDFIRSRKPEMILRRVIMKPMCKPSEKTLRPLPEGCSVSRFTPEIFARHPFDHGKHYRDYADFAGCGAGAAVLYGTEIVASASSYLTLGNEVELDVSTESKYQRKGLADHCVAEMMRQCAERKLTVHWDAQNTPSANMAKSHGFVYESEYAVYLLKKPESF